MKTKGFLISNIKPNSDLSFAAKLLEGTGVSLIDAARIIKNILDFKPKKTKLGNIQFCSKIVDSGIRHMPIREMSLKEGFVAYFATKSQLRPASIRDIKYLSKRIFSLSPHFANMNFSEITIADCEKCLNHCFSTPSQFNKAHRFLNGFFNYALCQEWTQRNVVKLVRRKKIVEKEIKAISIAEAKSLLKLSELPRYKDCQASLVLQLWAGIRPQEIKRLTWNAIDLDENIITIKAATSKTGGRRHIEICKALKGYLLKLKELKPPNSKLVPANWNRKWKELRRKAGFPSWTQDVLRHSYASYYVKYYQNMAKLQLNMGHSSQDLLRSRYVNLANISKDDAKNYFTGL